MLSVDSKNDNDDGVMRIRVIREICGLIKLHAYDVFFSLEH